MHCQHPAAALSLHVLSWTQAYVQHPDRSTPGTTLQRTDGGTRTVWVRDASGHGLAGVALPSPLVVPGQPPPAAPLRVVELRDGVEPARVHRETHNKGRRSGRHQVKKVCYTLLILLPFMDYGGVVVRI